MMTCAGEENPERGQADRRRTFVRVLDPSRLSTIAVFLVFLPSAPCFSPSSSLFSIFTIIEKNETASGEVCQESNIINNNSSNKISQVEKAVAKMPGTKTTTAAAAPARMPKKKPTTTRAAEEAHQPQPLSLPLALAPAELAAVEKQKKIDDLEKTVAEKNEIIQGLVKYIENLRSDIEKMQSDHREHIDNMRSNHRELLEWKDEQIARKNELVDSALEQLDRKDEQIARRDEQLQSALEQLHSAVEQLAA